VQRAAVLLVVVLVGCDLGRDEKTIDEADLDGLVLQQRDLAPGYRQTIVGSLGRRPAPERVRYDRTSSAAEPGPDVVYSTVQAFDSSRTADGHLDAMRDAVRERPGWQPIDEPGLGDESFAATVVERDVRRYEIVWREHNATASLQVEGSEGSLPLADVLALARKQERRISNAAD
jgi:hypothetical protein